MPETFQRDVEEIARADKERSLLAQQRAQAEKSALKGPKRIVTWDQETEMLKILSESQIAKATLFTPMYKNDGFSTELNRVFTQARINVSQCAIDLGERFPTGVRVFWTPEGNNSRDAEAIMRAIRTAGVQCKIAERQLNASADLLKESGIHIYVGVNDPIT